MACGRDNLHDAQILSPFCWQRPWCHSAFDLTSSANHFLKCQEEVGLFAYYRAGASKAGGRMMRLTDGEIEWDRWVVVTGSKTSKQNGTITWYSKQDDSKGFRCSDKGITFLLQYREKCLKLHPLSWRQSVVLCLSTWAIYFIVTMQSGALPFISCDVLTTNLLKYSSTLTLEQQMLKTELYYTCFRWGFFVSSVTLTAQTPVQVSGGMASGTKPNGTILQSQQRG